MNHQTETLISNCKLLRMPLADKLDATDNDDLAVICVVLRGLRKLQEELACLEFSDRSTYADGWRVRWRSTERIGILAVRLCKTLRKGDTGGSAQSYREAFRSTLHALHEIRTEAKAKVVAQRAARLGEPQAVAA
jgi:hypothetical protein